MTLVALASAKGGPGVSTTALVLASVWPRVTALLEADPAGSSVAPRLGLPLYPGGITDFAATHRHGFEVQDLINSCAPVDAGLVDRPVRVLLGVRSHAFGDDYGPLWEDVGRLVGRTATDVFLADCGRAYPGAPSTGLLQQAQLVVFLTRPTPEGVLHTRLRLDALRTTGHLLGSTATVVVGERLYEAAEVEQALGVPVLGVVADDPVGAALLSYPTRGRRTLRRTALVRSVTRLLPELDRSTAVGNRTRT